MYKTYGYQNSFHEFFVVVVEMLRPHSVLEGLLNQFAAG